MKKEEEIIRLMQERLSEAEAPVDASIWEAVQQQLPSAQPAGAASGGSGLSGLSATAKWVVGILSAVIPAAAVVYFVAVSDDDAAKAADDTVVVESKSATEQEQTDASGVSSPEKETEEAESTEKEPDTPAVTEANSAQSDRTPKRQQVQAIHSDPAADTITIERVEEQPGSPLIRGAGEQGETANQSATETNSTPSSGVQESTSATAALPEPQITVETEDRESLLYRFSAAAPKGAGYSYSWMINGEVFAEGAQVYHQFDREGIYALQLRAYRGAEIEKELNRELEVYLPARLELPNVFTPNGDGVNDRLTLGNGSRKVVIERMVVYDSNGREVFSQYGDGPGWDGTGVSGNELPEGNYILVLQAVSERGQPFNERQVVRLER